MYCTLIVAKGLINIRVVLMGFLFNSIKSTLKGCLMHGESMEICLCFFGLTK